MFKITGLVVFSLLLVSTTAIALDLGDPDSNSAPLVLEPEATSPDTNDNDDNPDARAGELGNVKTDVNAPDSTVPGAHMVAGLVDPNAQEEDDKWHEMKFARIQGLNKVTAKTSEIKADLGAKVKFGNLEFVVEKCLRGPENEKVENTALFTIWDEIPGQEKKQVFRGWMFSSSPAISALEHPIYDIILIGCGEAPKTVLPVASTDGKKDKKDKKPEDKKSPIKAKEKQ